MDDEPKTPAELKEIRLNRRRAQDAEGIKAMADIAAADIAIRKRTDEPARAATGAGSRRPRQSAGTEGQGQSESQRKKKTT